MNTWILTMLKLKEYTGKIFLTHKLKLGSIGKQHGGCEVRQMTPTLRQQKNSKGQQLGPNSSIRKLLLLIYKGGVLIK